MTLNPNDGHLRRLPSGASVFSKAFYEGKVVWQALRRAGANFNLKGHIHELLVRDRFNANPARLLDRKAALLVKNPTARAVDLIITRSGKVIHRLQLKDTPGSIRRVLQHIRKGRYSSVQVVGTRETVAEFEKAAGSFKTLKVMKPSGFSSRYTSSLARRAGAAGSGTIPRVLATAARTGGLWGAIICGGIALLQAVYKLATGKIKFREACSTVARETAGGAVCGATAGVAGTAAGVGIAALLAAIGLSGLLATVIVVVFPLIVAVVVGVLIKDVWDRLFRAKPTAVAEIEP
jgi:hypothetical protein